VPRPGRRAGVFASILSTRAKAAAIRDFERNPVTAESTLAARCGAGHAAYRNRAALNIVLPIGARIECLFGEDSLKKRMRNLKRRASAR
jgi:hypothetical protein